MKALEEKILREGTVLPGHILKVGSFLNQQLDVGFLMEMGEEIKRIYSDAEVTKILTIESSGIAIAVAAGAVMNVPVVFAVFASSFPSYFIVYVYCPGFRSICIVAVLFFIVIGYSVLFIVSVMLMLSLLECICIVAVLLFTVVFDSSVTVSFIVNSPLLFELDISVVPAYARLYL